MGRGELGEEMTPKAHIDDVDPLEGDDEEILYEDRTGITTDWLCGMRYWWARKEGGRGISPVSESLYLLDGRDIHEDCAAIAELEDLSPQNIGDLIEQLISSNRPTLTSQELSERFYRRLGWLAADALYMEPALRTEYDNVAVEGELVLDRTPLWVAVTPDRLLKHREGGYMVYQERKTTITAGSKWTNHWPYAIQVHLGLKAIEEEMGVRPAFGQIRGMLKGDNRGDRLAHPYVWAYRRGPDWTHDYTKARSAGWDHAPVWEYPGGVVEWVQRLGEEVARAQFPHSPPIFCNDRMVEDMILTRIARATEIAEVAERSQHDWQTRLLYFEQRFEQCRPAFGDPCPFISCCFNAKVNQNPLASRDYVIRTPHHEIEKAYLKGEV